MKGWRHRGVDQQIPPRDKNETGVYDGRHIFIAASVFACVSCLRARDGKKLTAVPRARASLLPSPRAGDERSVESVVDTRARAFDYRGSPCCNTYSNIDINTPIAFIRRGADRRFFEKRSRAFRRTVRA